MSVFGMFMSKILGPHQAAAQATAPPIAGQPPPTAPSGAAPPSHGAGGEAAAPLPLQEIDVEAVLTKMASETSQKLDWRASIVDLMKLLGLDSSLGARKDLARELHYSGPDDSAVMNIWLHKQVMKKLAENGGKVPDDLRS